MRYVDDLDVKNGNLLRNSSILTEMSEVSLVKDETVSECPNFFVKSLSFKGWELAKSSKTKFTKRILIIDDEHFNILALKSLIEIKIKSN